MAIDKRSVELYCVDCDFCYGCFGEGRTEDAARANAISCGCIIRKIGYAELEVVACPHCQEFTVGRVLDGSFPAGGS